jgi:carboxyl-terminal processing protease
MRRNSGGLLEQGMSISDLFLDRRQLVVETRGRTPEQNQSFRATRPDQYEGMQVAVLIGQRSASATEIVAGALQDHDRAVLIGQTTFGKGSVQTLYQLPGRNILKLTTARWYTPSGRTIQKPYGVGSSAFAVREDSGDVELVPDDARDAEEKRQDDVPIYRTDMGREVLGGGGITPDLVVADTLPTAVQRLVQEIQDRWPLFNNLLYRYAVEYARGHAALRPGFPVTAEMLNEFHGLLAAEGLDLDRAVYDGASPFVARRLANEISVVAFNREEGWKRLLEDDPQLDVALDLLRSAPTTAQLFDLLPSYAERRGLTLGLEAQVEQNGAAPHSF